MNLHKNRIQYIDGLRGLAILLVVFFHAFAKWTQLVPYGAKFAANPLFNKGWLGVNLFYLISGFVILMTLESCNGFRQFILKRWLRLFPAMLLATILIYISATWLSERPRGIPHLRDCLPGLLFVEHSWLGLLIPGKQDMLEGSFWSLFVEMKYYFIFGGLYFAVGKRRSLQLISLFCVITAVSLFISQQTSVAFLQPFNFIADQLSLIYLGWFVAGSLMYEFSRSLKRSTLIWAELIGSFSALSMALLYDYSLAVVIAAWLIVQGFLAVVVWDKLKPLISFKGLLLVGFISYPLYLIHENAMIALIIKTGRLLPFIPSVLLPVVPIAILMFVAYLIAKFAEPYLNMQLRNSLKKYIQS